MYLLDTNIYLEVLLEQKKYQEVKSISESFNLDFDDSYQYVIAKTYNLLLVTFDSDFDKTDLRKYELK